MIKRKAKTCSVCGKQKFLWKSNPPACKECHFRQQPNSLKRNPIKKTLSEKAKNQIAADERFYQEIWDERPHYCEECGKFLGDELQKVFFSHILTKGAHPELRHEKRNINVLCSEHHSAWEFSGKRNQMKINEKNKDAIVWILKRSIEVRK